MSRSRAFVVAAVAACTVAGAALTAEAKKPPKFKPVFMAKLPGQPAGAAVFKASVKGPTGAGTGFVYNDAVGSVTLNGVVVKPGLTTINVMMNVNVFAGMDLTDVTFPVSRPALVVLSYSKVKVNLKNPLQSKTTSYNYSSDGVTTLTVTSYDPVKGELTGTISGNVHYNQNEQDPNDDARDGEVVTLKDAKFALKSLTP